MNKCKWEKMPDTSKSNKVTEHYVECIGERVSVKSTVVSDRNYSYDKPFTFCPYCSKRVLLE